VVEPRDDVAVVRHGDAGRDRHDGGLAAHRARRPVQRRRRHVRHHRAPAFLGARTDAGVRGLGIGVALSVPYAKGGASDQRPEGGPGRTHLLDALILAPNLGLGVSYAPVKSFGFGVTGHYIYSSYSSRLDRSILTDLADAILEEAPFLGTQEDLYSPEDFENPDYVTRTDFGPLVGHGAAVTVGVFVRPVDELTISASFYSGATIANRGEMRFDFGCPPQDDLFGRLGAEREGLCDAEMTATGANSYTYPMRVNLGVGRQPTAKTRLELMGGWVRWSQFRDFNIDVDADSVVSANTELTDFAVENISQPLQFARANRDNFWVMVDGQFDVHPLVKIRGRAGFDYAAVPTEVLSPNNADFNTIKVGAGLDIRLRRDSPMHLGLSFLEDIGLARTNTDSAFGVSLLPDDRNEQRFDYPAMNGRYSGAIHRAGLAIAGEWGDWPRKR
jgi:long-subunit fatty acid transport protein